MSEDKIVITVTFPIALRRRAAAIGKKHRITTAQLIRDALTEKLDKIEEKERLEKSREDQEQKLKTDKRKRNIRLSDEDLAPERDSENEETDSSETIDPLYLQHAELITQVYDNPNERRLTALTGVKAICDRNPLTADPLTVEQKLSEIVKKLRAARPLTQVVVTAAVPPPQPQPKAQPSIIERLLSGIIEPRKSETQIPPPPSPSTPYENSDE